MKAISYLKNVLRVAVLVAVVSMLPGFTREVAADPLPDGISITRSDGFAAVPNDDYTLAENVLTLKTGGLTISGQEDCWFPYQIYDAIDSGTHIYTIENLTINCSSNGVNGLYLNSTDAKFLNVEGNCTIKVSSTATGIVYSNTLNITGSEGSSLTIEEIEGGTTCGINGSGAAGSNNSIYFQGPSSGNPFRVDITTSRLAIGTPSGCGNVLSVGKNTEVICNGNYNDASGLVNGYKYYAINGKLSVNNVGSGSALTLYDGDRVSVGSDASVLLRSSGDAAIYSKLSTGLSSNSFGAAVARGSEFSTNDESLITKEITVSAYSSGSLSKSTIVGGDTAKTVLIAGCYTVTLEDLLDDDPQKVQKVFKGGNVTRPSNVPVDPYGGTYNEKWYVDEDRSEEWDFDNTVTGEMTLYPGYKYIVKFDSQGGSPATLNNQEVSTGETISDTEPLTKEDYSFAGWLYKNGDSYDYGPIEPSHAVDGEITLYADWMGAGLCAVTFDSMGGSNVLPRKVGCGSRVTKPADPTRKGYKFAGWYKDKNYNTKFDFDEDVILDNTILYAKWEGSGKHKSDKEEKKSTEVEYIDRDTFKSEYPGGTVLAINLADANQFYDMKVHSSDAQTVTNQELLSTLLLGADAKAVITRGVYMRSDLPTYEDGELRVLKWKNLPINTAGTVRAVVYNAVDGAYVIDGVVDATGTAAFMGFKLRPASTITICK